MQTLSSITHLQDLGKSDKDVWLVLLDKLEQLEGRLVALWVVSQDGYYQEMIDGRWDSPEGGRVFVVGQVVDKGVQDWVTGPESYLVINADAEPLKKVFISGITKGFLFDEANLIALLREGLEGESDAMAELLLAAGFESL